MRASQIALSGRQRGFAGEHLALLAAAFVSALAGTLVATSPKWVLALILLSVFACAVAFTKRERLPSLALLTFAVFAAPYLGLPKTFGSFLAPATLVMLVWALRTIAAEWTRGSIGRTWIACATAICGWFAIETVLSLRPTLSVMWTLVFTVTLPLAGTAALIANDGTRALLIRTWTAMSIVLGTFGTFEGLARWNPLARHFTIDGQPLVQKWSVYRIETTLGHPLVNAMFFATSAAVMTMLAIEKPTRSRVAAALLATSGLVFTASRTGVIGLSLGIGMALVAMTFSRRTPAPRKVLAIAAIAGALVVVVQSPILKERDRSGEAQASSTYRSNVMHKALGAIVADHLLGSGPGTSQRRVDRTGTPLVVEDSLLQLGVSTGVPGVVLFLALITVVASSVLRRGRWESFAGLIACVVAATGFNAWDTVPETLTLLGLVVVLALAPDHEPSEPASDHVS